MPEDPHPAVPSSPGALARLRSSIDRIALPFATAAICALIFCAYYFTYVRQRSQYLSERNFRALSITGEQLSATIGNYGSILTAFGREATRRNLSPQNQVEYLRFLAPHLGCFETSSAVGSSREEPILLKWNGNWTLNVNVFSNEPGKPLKRYHGCLDVKTLVDPLTAAAPFGDVFIVSDDGSIVYQKNRVGPRFATLKALLQTQANPKEPEKTDKAGKANEQNKKVDNRDSLGSLAQWLATGVRSAGSKRAGQVDLPHSRTLVAEDPAPPQAELTIAGVKYKAFFAPALVNLYSQGDREENVPRQWTIGGLVRSDAFQWEAWARRSSSSPQ